MTPFTVYGQTGRILRSGTCQTEVLDRQAGEGEFAIGEASNDLIHYVKDGAIVPRPTMDLAVSTPTVPADGVTEVTVCGVPADAEVRIDGPVKQSGKSEGTKITLTFAIPGDYDVHLVKFPYQDAKVTIHAV